MVKRAMVMAVAMALTFVAFTSVATAQEEMVVNIPFDFVAGNTTLPAGEYYVKTDSSRHSLLLVDRQDPATSVFLPTMDVIAREAQPQSKLIFSRYGERFFLTQVWAQGNLRGRQLFKSNREKEMAQTAKLETTSQVTLVAQLTRNNP